MVIAESHSLTGVPFSGAVRVRGWPECQTFFLLVDLVTATEPLTGPFVVLMTPPGRIMTASPDHAAREEVVTGPMRETSLILTKSDAAGQCHLAVGSVPR